MALYEIRTLKTRHRVSLISYGEFASDIAALLAARQLMRRGEALEVWRGEKLIYRSALSSNDSVTQTARKEKDHQRNGRVPVWRIFEILAGKTQPTEGQ